MFAGRNQMIVLRLCVLTNPACCPCDVERIEVLPSHRQGFAFIWQTTDKVIEVAREFRLDAQTIALCLADGIFRSAQRDRRKWTSRATNSVATSDRHRDRHRLARTRSSLPGNVGDRIDRPEPGHGCPPLCTHNPPWLPRSRKAVLGPRFSLASSCGRMQMVLKHRHYDAR